MCDWHLEPDKRFKVTYKDRFCRNALGERVTKIMELHVLANTKEEAEEIAKECVDEIVTIEEI